MNSGKTFVVYFEWENTASNHSGMAYLFRFLKKENKKYLQLIRIPSSIDSWNKYFRKSFSYILIFILWFLTSPNDKILFVEYLGNCSGDQTWMAKKLRKLGLRGKIYGIVHLSESNLLELYGSEDYLRESLFSLDKIIVLGSSLEDYFIRLGFRDKVIRTFHYVDCNYYGPSEKKTENKRLRIISIGSLKRNFNYLREIIENCPDVDFEICMGKSRLEDMFKGLHNVTLYGFITEQQLLELMQKADVSISVLYDTVGSNVITTSLACGLPQIVSDTGSIRDYCDATNSILCNSLVDFVNAINKLQIDESLRDQMSQSAKIKAKTIDLNVFGKWFFENIILS